MGRDFNDDPMSEADLAAHFNIPVPESKPEQPNDIYKVSARIKNKVRVQSGNLTPAGDILCNSYSHVIKSLYDFAEKLPEPHKSELIAMLANHESMPADVVAAIFVGIKVDE